MAITVHFIQGDIHKDLIFPDGFTKPQMEAAIKKLPFYRPPAKPQGPAENFYKSQMPAAPANPQGQAPAAPAAPQEPAAAAPAAPGSTPKVPPPSSSVLENAKVQSIAGALPAAYSEEVARISNMEHPDDPYWTTLAKNIIPNLKRDISGVIDTPVALYHFGKDMIEDYNQFLKGGYYNKNAVWHASAVEDMAHTLHLGLRAFMGEPISNEDLKNPGSAWGAYANKKGVGNTLALYVRNNPLDALMILNGAANLGVKGIGLSAEKLASTGGKAAEIAKKVKAVLHKTRDPIVYDLSSTMGKGGHPDISDIEPPAPPIPETHAAIAHKALVNPLEAYQDATKVEDKLTLAKNARAVAREAIAGMKGKKARAKAVKNFDNFMKNLPLTDEQRKILHSGRKGIAHLQHYSYVKGLTEVDPAFFGNGLPGAESARKMADPSNFVDRSYYAIKGGGYLPEPGLGTFKYKTSIPYEDLYDMMEDPEHLMGDAKAEALEKGTSPATIYERMIRDKGYKGYYVNDPIRGDTAALFQKMPVDEEVPIGKPVTMPKKDWKIAQKKLVIQRKAYSENVGYRLFQQSFDGLLAKYPEVYKMWASHLAKKTVSTMRLAYDNANFAERNLFHNEIMKQINTLTPEEQKVAVPYFEGRAGLIQEPSKQFQDFEKWYRNKVEEISSDLVDRKVLDPGKLDDVIYGPLMQATGQTLDQVKKDLGDFTPVYVHHVWPEVHPVNKTVHFAETTGKSYVPGFLKHRNNYEGYSTDLSRILPDWASSYVKYKNSQAFLDEFMGKFGTPVNLKDIKAVEGGFQVGDNFFGDHKIIAPDGYLSFFRGKVNFGKRIVKKLKETNFDEAVIQSIDDLSKTVSKEYLGVSKNKRVFLVPTDAANKLESFAQPFFGSRTADNVAKIIFDKPTQFWKDSVLAFSPRWITNNVISDFVLNTISGVGPLSYSRAFQTMYKDCIPDEISQASFTKLEQYAPQLGNAAKSDLAKLAQKAWDSLPEAAQKAATKTGKGWGWAKEKGYHLNELFEHPMVRSYYIHEASKVAKRLLKARGEKVNDVNVLNELRVIKENPGLYNPLIEKVKANLPVFNLTGPWERKYLRRLIPFYNWYKFMAIYGAKLPIDHPFVSALAGGMGNLSEAEREKTFEEYFPWMTRIIDENGIPDRYRNLWPVGYDKKTGTAHFFNLGAANPLETIGDMLELKPSALNPILTTPVEWMKGVNTYTGQPFTSPDAQLITGAKGEEYKEFSTVSPPLLELIARNFPEYEMLEKLLVPAKQFDTGTVFNPEPKVDPITGEYKYPISKLQTALGFFGISSKMLDIDKSWNGYVRKMRIAQRNDFNSKNISLEDVRAIIKWVRQDKVKFNQIKQEMKHQAEVKARNQQHLLEDIRNGNQIR